MSGRVIRITDSLIVPPVVPPVTVEYAKRHLRSLGNSEDVLVETWIWAATSYIEEMTGRQIGLATREAWLDAFPGAPGGSFRHLKIELPHPPLQSVVNVTYVDGDGAVQTFEDPSTSPATSLINVRAPQGDYAAPGTVEPIAGQSWPIARCESDAVRIQYTCGYGATADDTPALLRGAILYLVAHFDQFRQAVHEARRGQVLELPYGVQEVIKGFKYSSLSTIVLREGGPSYHGGYYR
jgi:uncharacterized phiE125 gp8 family phage protein